MTPNPDKIHRRSAQFAILATLALMLGACASVPPPLDRMTRAENAFTAATDAGARTWAPLELGFAEEKLAAAQDAMARRHYDDAGDFAEESQINSDLARIKAELGQQRENNDRARAENDRLRSQLLDNAPQPPTTYLGEGR